MKKDGSINILIGIIGVIVVLFVMLQVVSSMTGPAAIAEADSSLPASLSKPTGDDIYRAASGNREIPKDMRTDNVVSAPQTVKLEGKKVEIGQSGAKNPVVNKEKSTVKPVTSKKVEEKESMVTVSIKENVGRLDPFLPAIEIKTRGESELPKLPVASYHHPPVEIQENPAAEKLMQTTISGIMYDAFAPSAIISVEGQDHLVRKGDRINGYKILDITKSRVVVQNGTNIYRAVVGETLTAKEEGIIYNNVYNLQRKFAGANAPENTEMIEIN